jgi:hypothetical protein
MKMEACTMSKRWMNGLMVMLVGSAFACGGGEGGGEPAAETAAEAEPAAPAVDPATAATINGMVTFEGTPAANAVIDMSEEPACADVYTSAPPMTEEVVTADGGLANVFVYVKEGLDGSFGTPAEPVEIDQQGCRYRPHVVGIQTGQPLLIKNSDPLLHNINTQPTTNRGFNISQPQANMESTREFSRAEVMIPVKCDVHGWMGAYLGVVDHPYFNVSDSGGSFTLASLPPGTYVVEAWHEVYGTVTQEVTVGAAETAEITFAFNADMAKNAQVPLGEPLVLHAREGSDQMTSQSDSH